MSLYDLLQRQLYFFTCRWCSYLTGNNYEPLLSVTGIALLLYMQMMFVPQRKHTYEPPRSITEIALLFCM
jgi:hypothetical protein